MEVADNCHIAILIIIQGNADSLALVVKFLASVCLRLNKLLLHSLNTHTYRVIKKSLCT
jgi:hypothetical protein